MKKINLILISTSLFLFSCGSDSSVVESTSIERNVPENEFGNIITAMNLKEVSIMLFASDNMVFNAQEITVFEHQEITLILSHTGKSHKNTMGHNFVLLEEGVVISEFGREASKFQQRDYIPEDTSKIIVHTRLLSGGESDTIKFKAPAKGIYPYLCSFPGHYSVMKGKFIVKEDKTPKP